MRTPMTEISIHNDEFKLELCIRCSSKNTKVVTKRWKPIKNPQAERKERLFTHETQKHAMYILIYIKGKAY